MKLNSGSSYKVDKRLKKITIKHGSSFSQQRVNQLLTGWTQKQSLATHGPATSATSIVRHIPSLYDHILANNNGIGFWTGQKSNIISIFRAYAAIVADPSGRHFVTSPDKRKLRIQLFMAYIPFLNQLDFSSDLITLSLASKSRIMKFGREFGIPTMDAVQGFFRTGRGVKQNGKKPCSFPNLPNTLLDFIEITLQKPYRELIADARILLKPELDILNGAEPTSARNIKEEIINSTPEVTQKTESPPVTANRERSIEREIELIKRILHEHPDLMDEEELKNAVYSIGDAVRAAIKKKIEHLEKLI